MTDYFAPDSVIRRVTSEPAILFGAGRALMLQLAHPAVAQGVADHSDFEHDPFRRLFGTLEAMSAVTFGSANLAERTGRRVQWIHEYVAGPGYAASDPENLLWVQASLTDSALFAYTRLMGPLGNDDAETFYQEMTRIAEIFGCPRSEQPGTLVDFRSYVDDMVNTLEVTDVGRRLAADVVSPRLPTAAALPLAPLVGMHGLATVGTTPAPLREQYGYRWTARHRRRLDLVLDSVGAVLRATPRPLRVSPVRGQSIFLHRLARKHATDFERRMLADARDIA